MIKMTIAIEGEEKEIASLVRDLRSDESEGRYLDSAITLTLDGEPIWQMGSRG